MPLGHQTPKSKGPKPSEGSNIQPPTSTTDNSQPHSDSTSGRGKLSKEPAMKLVTMYYINDRAPKFL